jgi:small subunit ribosomal protein S16
LKQHGRKHRPFFRLVATDIKAQRDGRVIEELGFYDPMVRNTDARAILDGERIAYWLGVGAQPSETARVLIKKYGKEGTHLKEQQLALEQLGKARPKAKRKPKPATEPVT